MRKTDKKLDNKIRLILTDVCENALEHIDGFVWLTHRVNYNKFPDSLCIVCVFDTNIQLQTYVKSQTNVSIKALIKSGLSSIDITLKSIDKHVSYDTEEACTLQNDGNWSKRLA